MRKLRTGTGLLALLLLCALALPASGRRVERLDVEIATPVYRLPDGLSLPHQDLRYALRWAGIPLGGVDVAMVPAKDGSGLQVAVRGATVPAISWLYSLRFTAEGLVRTAPFEPGRFALESCEGRRHKRTQILFPAGGEEGPIRGIRDKKGRITEYLFESDNSYDVPSAIYLLLNQDYAPGQQYFVDAFTGETRYLVHARVEGREKVQSGGRSMDAWHLRLTTKDLTEEDPDRKHRGTSVWVSDAQPRQLLRARTQTYVGSVTLELEPGRDREVDGRCS